MQVHTIIPYANFKALRAAVNSVFIESTEGGSLVLRTTAFDERIQAGIDLIRKEGDVLFDQANLNNYTATMAPFANLPIDKVEVRFKTHDWNDPADWDQRTHGDCCAYLVGGYLKHPLDGSWLDATGAGMISAWATPGSGHTGDPNYLFGAWLHRITAKYDDVKYQWLSADGATRYAWLDTSTFPCKWKNDAGAVVVHFSAWLDATDPAAPVWRNDAGTVIANYAAINFNWLRNDTGAVVTNSLWRILPYPDYKLQINKVKTTVDATAVFTGALYYQVYMDMVSGDVRLPAGAPSGNYKVADWQYKSLAELASGSDADPYIEPITRPGHSGPIMILSYDYLQATKTPVIDSALNMRLDVSISDNKPVTGTLGASATFICMKIRSF